MSRERGGAWGGSGAWVASMPRPTGAKAAKSAKDAKATRRSSGVVYAARRGRCPSRLPDRALEIPRRSVKPEAEQSKVLVLIGTTSYLD